MMTSQLVLAWLISSQTEELQYSIKQPLTIIHDFSKQIASQNNQMSLLIDDVSELNESVDSLIEDLSPPKSLINKAHNSSNQEDQILKNLTKKTNVTKSISLSSVTSSIKYLGSGMRDEFHKVLLETPAGIHFYRIGDIVFKQWRLSAIEQQKVLLTAPNGQQQIIQLSKVLP
jgi:hypothetical protein